MTPPIAASRLDRGDATDRLFPRLGELAADSPAVPFVNHFVKLCGRLFCRKCMHWADLLPHECRL